MANLKNRTLDEGRAIVAQYRDSGLSQARFAKRLGISVSVIRYWVRRLRDIQRTPQSESGVRFLEVVPQAAPARQVETRVELPGGIILKTDELPSPAYLAELADQFQRRSAC